MLTPREKSPLPEAQRRVKLVKLHHAGQQAQHTTDKQQCSDKIVTNLKLHLSLSLSLYVSIYLIAVAPGFFSMNLVMAGRAHHHLHQYDKARDCFTRAARVTPCSPDERQVKYMELFVSFSVFVGVHRRALVGCLLMQGCL